MSFSENYCLFNGRLLNCRLRAARIAIRDFLCKKIRLVYLWISKTFEGTYLTAVVTYPQLVFLIRLAVESMLQNSKCVISYTFVELDSS